MPVNIIIPELGEKFQDYRDGIPGDSYGWGPVINALEIAAFTYHHSVTAQLLAAKRLAKFKGDPNSLGDDDLRIISPTGKTAAWKNPQTAINDGNWKKECDTIANLHLANGWGGVGYRFIICSNGVVAYVGDLARGGSAVGNFNNVMFSACFVGDFTKQLPTAAQVHSAHILAKWFLTKAPQYPNLKNWDQVKGHKEYNPTICPSPAWKTAGDNLYGRIKDDVWQGYPNPQPIIVPVPVPTDWQKKYNQEVIDHEKTKKKVSTLEGTVSGLQEKINKARVSNEQVKKDLA